MYSIDTKTMNFSYKKLIIFLTVMVMSLAMYSPVCNAQTTAQNEVRPAPVPLMQESSPIVPKYKPEKKIKDKKEKTEKKKEKKKKIPKTTVTKEKKQNITKDKEVVKQQEKSLEKTPEIKQDNEIKLDLSGQKQPTKEIKTSEPVKKIEGDLFTSKDDLMEEYFKVQKKLDVEDIKVLWEATTNRNPIIKFALDKLALPPEQRRIHSSIMAKTVSTLISGVAILPGIFGADPVTSSASSAVGAVANRVISNKNMPKNIPLTDTELIHLAKLVEDLQDRMIKNYYEYKNGLEALKLARKEVLKQQIEHSLAVRTNDPLNIITTQNLYENAIKDEIDLKQKLLINRIELERLAGVETLNKLQLGKVSIESAPPPDAKKLPSMPLNSVNDYSDKTIQELSSEIGDYLANNKNDLLNDLNILWNAAVEKNETMRFAIMKLSNPNGTVEKKSLVKKVFAPVAGVASVVGMGIANPVAASSSVIGGGMLGSMLTDENQEFNLHLSKVTDADLVLLAQQIDDLQQKMVNLYLNYSNALYDLNYQEKTVKSRKEKMIYIQQNSPEFLSVAEVFYKEALSEQSKAMQNVMKTHVELEQLVGSDAIMQIDANIKERFN